MTPRRIALATCAVAVVAALGVAAAPRGERAVAQRPPDAGRDVYDRDCAVCHGPQGEGSPRGPSLVGVGAASAHYWLASGRMPLDSPEEVPRRGDPAYPPAVVEALVDYVASLGEGPPVPVVDPAAGDLSRGAELYLEHCAACHSAEGRGGALQGPRHAPDLRPVPPVQVAEAMLLGPGPMPSFDGVLDRREVADVLRYVDYLDEPSERGGVALGRGGPALEAVLAFLVAMLVLVPLVRWIGRGA